MQKELTKTQKEIYDLVKEGDVAFDRRSDTYFVTTTGKRVTAICRELIARKLIRRVGLSQIVECIDQTNGMTITEHEHHRKNAMVSSAAALRLIVSRIQYLIDTWPMRDGEKTSACHPLNAMQQTHKRACALLKELEGYSK